MREKNHEGRSSDRGAAAPVAVVGSGAGDGSGFGSMICPIYLAGGGGVVRHHKPTLRAPVQYELSGGQMRAVLGTRRTGKRTHTCEDCGQQGSRCFGSGIHGKLRKKVTDAKRWAARGAR